jgi:hypothetical protein
MTDTTRWKSTVYIGGLAPLVTTTTLQEAFLPFGEIADVSLPKNENPQTAATEPHRGFAYVEFEDVDDAKEAIDNMDQAELFGRVIKVSAAKAPKSAGQGLGAKTAVWEQVCFVSFCLVDEGWVGRDGMLTAAGCRKGGWQRMLLVRRTGWRRTRLRIRRPRTRCRGWRGWMWLGRSRNEDARSVHFQGTEVPQEKDTSVSQQVISRVWENGVLRYQEQWHSYGVGAAYGPAFMSQGKCMFGHTPWTTIETHVPAGSVDHLIYKVLVV